MRIPTVVLPKTLIDSLYRLEESNKRSKEKSHKEVERSSNTLQGLLDKLRVIGDQTHIDESILAMSFTHNSSQFSLTPSKATKQKVVRHKLLVSSIAKPQISSNKIQSIHMKMVEEKARNVKDVNLNINLNLRVFPEQNEYQIFRDKQTSQRTGKLLNLAAKQSTDNKNLNKIKKLSGSESRGTFRRKAKPDELRASSKDHSSESKLVRKVIPRSRYIDSDHSLSQKKTAPPTNSIPVSSLHIPNFGKVITAMGAEYKKASGSRTIRTRKSRNLENILIKYRQFQEKTAEIESARKDKSEKKTIATARSRIGIIESNRPTVMESARQSKVNFKRKKLSLQYPQNNQNSSKELARPQPIGINLAAVNLYQTSQPPKPKRETHRLVNDRSKADTGDSNREKLTGSASARANTNQVETSVVQHIVHNLGGKIGNHKLSLSTSTVPILLNHKITDSKDSTSVKKLLHLDQPKPKRDLRPKSGKGTAIIQGSKFNRMMNQDIQRKADSKDNIIKKSRSSAKTLRAAGFKSIDKTQEDKLLKHKMKPDSEKLCLGMHSYSKSEIKPPQATFANIHIATGLGLTKSRPHFSIPMSKIQSLLAQSKVNK